MAETTTDDRNEERLRPARLVDRLLIVRGMVLATIVGVLSGATSAMFLESLRVVTRTFDAHPWLLFGLPASGALIAWLYAGHGRSVAGGNNLILEHIHSPREVGVPLRMAPLILVTTLITHLFGGSAGREGTAVQMGGALAGWVAHQLKLDQSQRRLLLMTGISGGFSGVFGTPLAGTIFGMEMLALGGVRYEALIPCLIAALVADLTVRFLDVSHAQYAVQSALPAFSATTLILVAVAGVAFGLVSALFTELTVAIEHHSRRIVPRPMLRTAVGGVVVVVITLLLGTRIYNGLSLPLLAEAFVGGDVPIFAFAIKLGLTAITLGFGFKGGEVTPLFVIGGTLGVSLSVVLALPPDFLAALGFVAVFGAAANTPLACVALSAELFGGDSILYFGIAIFVAYTVSGHRGIYSAQRVVSPKRVRPTEALDGLTLGGPRGLRRDRRDVES